VMGLQIEKIEEQLFQNITLETSSTLHEKCKKEENRLKKEKGGCLYEDVEATLTTLIRKYELYIVSNCQAGYIESFYAYHQLGNYFIDEEIPDRSGVYMGENSKIFMDITMSSYTE